MISKSNEREKQFIKREPKKVVPGPGFYDNFKVHEDRSKKRACTMGKRWESGNRNDASPGPGKYNISQAAKKADGGGHGQTTTK